MPHYKPEGKTHGFVCDNNAAGDAFTSKIADVTCAECRHKWTVYTLLSQNERLAKATEQFANFAVSIQEQYNKSNQWAKSKLEGVAERDHERGSRMSTVEGKVASLEKELTIMKGVVGGLLKPDDGDEAGYSGEPPEGVGPLSWNDPMFRSGYATGVRRKTLSAIGGELPPFPPTDVSPMPQEQLRREVQERFFPKYEPGQLVVGRGRTHVCKVVFNVMGTVNTVGKVEFFCGEVVDIGMTEAAGMRPISCAACKRAAQAADAVVEFLKKHATPPKPLYYVAARMGHVVHACVESGQEGRVKMACGQVGTVASGNVTEGDTEICQGPTAISCSHCISAIRTDD